jgi:hypothetical protein
MVVDQSERFRGNIGPFFLLLVPFIILRRNIARLIKPILAFSFFYSLIWLFTGGHGRYYVPILPCLSVIASYGLVNWLETGQSLSHKLLARITAVVLVLMACFNTPFFEQYGANQRYGFPILGTLPMKYLLGQESRESYLARYVPSYPVVEYLNRQSGPKKPLFWWTSGTECRFYLDSEGASHYSAFSTKLFGEDPDQLHEVLKQNGVTHIITGQHHQEANLLTRPEGNFVRRYLKKIYQKNAVVLYEVASGAVAQEILFYDFLGHLDEAKIRMPTEPPGKPNAAYRTILRIGEDARYALLTFPPAEVEFRLRLPERPVLQFAIGQYIPGCSGNGSFQVWIASANREKQKLYERALYAEAKPQDVGWFDERIDLAEYAGQVVDVIFKTELLGGSQCNWYLFADPVIISPP